MPIRFLCPMGHPLIVPDDLAGTEGSCPTCRQRVLIPVADPDAVDREHKVVSAAEIQAADTLSRREIDPSIAFGPPAWTRPLDDVPDAMETLAAPPMVDHGSILPPPPPPSKSHGDRYIAPPERIRLAYGIAVIAGVLAFAAAMPAFGELRHPPAPAWAWILIFLWLVQIGYAFWLASLPDWSTVWLGMALYGLLAALAAFVLVVAIVTPATRELPLGLEEVRSSLAGWCALMLVFDGALAYAAGWISARWRREYVAAKAAARGHK